MPPKIDNLDALDPARRERILKDRKWYAENKERAAVAGKKYRDAHKEQSKAYQAAYHLKHLEKCKEYNRTHKAKAKAWKLADRAAKPHLHWASGTLKNHKAKFDIRITREELTELAKVTDRCRICGIELKYGGGNGPSFNSASLDRTNNEQHIDSDNCEIVCFRCNTAKGQGSEAELIEYCKIVVERAAI